MTGAAITAEQPTQVIRPNRRKVVVLVIGGFALGITGLSMATNAPMHIATASLSNHVVGALGAVMFGIGSVMMGVQMGRDLPPLMLTREGLRIFHWRGSKFYAWHDVGAFAARGRYVWLDFDPRFAEYRQLRRLNRRWFGNEGMISPYVYGMSSADLASLLNSWRDRYLSPHGV